MIRIVDLVWELSPSLAIEMNFEEFHFKFHRIRNSYAKSIAVQSEDR